MTRIHLGISTCPNDTFTFHGLMTREVDWLGLDFDVELTDIAELNGRLFRGEFDVAKASFSAALHLANETVVLPSGSAIGFGVGPVLLSASPQAAPCHPQQLTLSPGPWTTARLLFDLFHPHTTRVTDVVFSQIMPSLVRREADFGICIHEGRFTWQDQGLHLVEDLGVRWEQETSCPLPLGGILARRTLSPDLIATVQEVVRASLEFARANPTAPRESMRLHAQEFDDDVLKKHVELYVNDWTLELGETGTAALHELSKRAAVAGACTASVGLQVFSR